MKIYIFKNIRYLFNFTALLFSILFLSSCEGEAESYDRNADIIKEIESGILNGVLTQDYTLDANVPYKLEGSFVVSTGATLTIPAGTQIEARKGGSNIFIAVLQGAKININGTASSPVVMSTYDGVQGGWGGVSIFGNAPSKGERSISANFYGGTNEEDNSGTISYLNIIGSGNNLASNENFNGLSLYGVGSGTTINNIALINGKDDGVEFYGGTVSITNLYLENNLDDSIDWTEGWNGSITNAYIVNNNVFSTAVEGDFVQEVGNQITFENPTIRNLTLIYTYNEESDIIDNKIALQFKSESGASISGLYIEGYDIDIDMADNGNISNVVIDGVTPDTTAISSTGYTLNSGNSSEKIDIDQWTWIRDSL